MSVDLVNRYALFNVDGEESDAPQTTATPQPAVSATQPKQTRQSEGKPQERSERQGPRDNSGRGRGGPRGGRGGQDRPPRRMNDDGTPAEAGAFVADKPRGAYRGRGGDNEGGERSGRGGGRGRGGRGREFDRHSGSGRREGEKLQTIGRGNWGRPGEVPSDKVEGGQEVAKEEGDQAESAKEDRGQSRADGAYNDVEEDDNTKTLDEYLQERNAATRNAPQKSLRSANEGQDAKQWKDAGVLKKEEEEFFSGNKGQKTKKQKEQQKKIEAIEIEPMPLMMNQAQSSRGSRRGGSRGGAPRGGGSTGRGGSARQTGRKSDEPAPVFDDSSFPTLGK